MAVETNISKITIIKERDSMDKNKYENLIKELKKEDFSDAEIKEIILLVQLMYAI